MGLFSRKPSIDIQNALMNQANAAMNIFGHALQHKATIPQDDNPDSSIDLEVEENRMSISAELSRIVRECGLVGCSEAQIGSTGLMPFATKQPKSAVEDAALCAAVAINSINLIYRLQKDEFPKYKPMAEMVAALGANCCPGAAQMLGPDLPDDVVKTWPQFASLFSEIKASRPVLWPHY